MGYRGPKPRPTTRKVVDPLGKALSRDFAAATRRLEESGRLAPVALKPRGGRPRKQED